MPLELTKPLLTTGVGVHGAQRRRLTLRGGDGNRARFGVGVLDDDVCEVHDLLVTSPLRTCFDLMRERQLVEAVVVADAFLYAGAVHREHLAAYCTDARRWPGVREARVAVSLASPAARSSGESRLRMVVVLGGLEEPLVNVPVIEGERQHVATPDLQVRGRSWAWLEYDGAYHETEGQHAADVRRENRLVLTASGIPVLRYDRRHMLGDGPERVLAEIVTATRTRNHVQLDLRDFWRPRAPRQW